MRPSSSYKSVTELYSNYNNNDNAGNNNDPRRATNTISLICVCCDADEARSDWMQVEAAGRKTFSQPD